MAVKGSYKLAEKPTEDQVLDNILERDEDGNWKKPISRMLYEQYADNYRRAVKAVPIDNPVLSAQWNANVSRFAAYKAYHVTRHVRRSIQKDGDLDYAKAIMKMYNRYQATEYNTAVARARTGKQWLQFNEEDNTRLFPYIEWLPSRSATPREAHRIFWNCRWRKDDIFWQENQPGTLWNCKCDWEETDEEPDLQKNKEALEEAEEMKRIATEAKKPNPLCLPGLDQNPATSGQIFTDTASYIERAPADTEWNCKTACRDYVKVAAQRNTGVYCDIKGTKHNMDFSDKEINNHFAKEMIKAPYYWLKNEILLNPQPYLDKATLVGKKKSDASHNKKDKTVKLKQATDYYFYYQVPLADGSTIYLHIGRFRNSGNTYLYSATPKPPKNMETP